MSSSSHVEISLRGLDSPFEQTWKAGIGVRGTACHVCMTPDSDIVLTTAEYRNLPRRTFRVLVKRDGEVVFRNTD